MFGVSEEIIHISEAGIHLQRVPLDVVGGCDVYEAERGKAYDTFFLDHGSNKLVTTEFAGYHAKDILNVSELRLGERPRLELGVSLHGVGPR